MDKPKKVFIAAPLFNEMELERNCRVKKAIESWGFSVFLGQDDVGLSYDVIDTTNKAQVRREIFQKDVQGVKECDVIVFLLDGRIPDEGACIEVGMAFAWGKICIGYKSDNRAMDKNGDNNIMIDGCLGFQMATNLNELKVALMKIVKV